MSDTQEPLLIDQQLPASYLQALGAYIQTCAQIEYWICEIIYHIDHFTKNKNRKTKEELRLLSVKELISALGKAARRLPENDDWYRYFKEETAWMHQFSNNRHLAVHGLHYQYETSITINYIDKKTKEECRKTIQAIDITELLRDADRILRNIRRFCEEYQQV